MKKSIIFLALFFSIILSYGQEYDTWSIEPSIGLVKVRDINNINTFTTELGIRKMLNTKFGVKLSGGYTSSETSFETYLGTRRVVPINYTFGSLHGVVNIGRALNFEDFTKHYTILFGLGGTYTYSTGESNLLIFHQDHNFHMSGFIDNEIKLSNSIFLRAGIGVITGVNSRAFVIEDVNTVTTPIITFNAGITVSIGKKKNHADFYLPEEITKEDLYTEDWPSSIDSLTVSGITTTDVPTYIIQEPEPVVTTTINTQYIYFDNDSDQINRDALWVVEQLFQSIDKAKEINIRAYASNIGTDSYNFDLCSRRIDSVLKRLITLGIDDNNINKITGVINGIDLERDDKSIHDMARRIVIETIY